MPHNGRKAPRRLLLRGHVLHNLHRFREAEGLAHQLVAQRGLAYDYGLLGDVLLEQGKLAEAIEAYQRMMDQKPSPQAYSRTAHVRWLTGDLTGALAVMRMAVGVSGFHDTEAAAWAYVRLALYELQADLLPQASQHMAAALALQPQYPPALLTRGRMLLAEGKNAEAVAALAHAVQLNPLPEYQWGLIEALQAANRAEEARAIETQLMQRGATNDRRTFALYLATTRRDSHTALQLAEEELTVRADVFTLDTLAWALHAVGRYQEARAYSGRALAEGTQEARLFYHAGVIAAAVQEPEEAAHWLAKATAIRQMLWPSEREHLATRCCRSLSWRGVRRLSQSTTTLTQKGASNEDHFQHPPHGHRHGVAGACTGQQQRLRLQSHGCAVDYPRPGSEHH